MLSTNLPGTGQHVLCVAHGYTAICPCSGTRQAAIRVCM